MGVQKFKAKSLKTLMERVKRSGSEFLPELSNVFQPLSLTASQKKTLRLPNATGTA
jgi:hypothetical protein